MRFLSDNDVDLGFILPAIGFWEFLSFERFSEVDELDFYSASAAQMGLQIDDLR